MKYSVNGIGSVVITAEGSKVNLGDLVTFSGNFQAETAKAEAEPMGVCVSKNGNCVGIQVSGGTVVACTDGTLTPGYRMLKVAEGNKVALGTTGTPHLVLSVDESAGIAEVLW